MSFKVEDTNETGETVGRAYVFDRDEPDRALISEEEKLGWTTLTDAEAFARSMGYECDLA